LRLNERRATNIVLLYPKVRNNIGGIFPLTSPNQKIGGCVPGIPGGVNASACRLILKKVKGKRSPYSITERRVPRLIPILGRQPAGGVSRKPGGRLPLLSARPAVTLATPKSCYQFRCLVNRGTVGVNSLPKTVTDSVEAAIRLLRLSPAC